MQRQTAKELREMYFTELRRGFVRRIGRSVFVLILAAIAFVLADAATEEDEA